VDKGDFYFHCGKCTASYPSGESYLVKCPVCGGKVSPALCLVQEEVDRGIELLSGKKIDDGCETSGCSIPK